MRQLVLIGLLLASSACVTQSVEGLSPSTQVYAMQREFNDLYLGPIIRYVGKDFCDVGADPPVITNCADAQTTIILNEVAQDMGIALRRAQISLRSEAIACEVPTSFACKDKTALLTASVEALRVMLTRVSTEYVRAGLDK